MKGELHGRDFQGEGPIGFEEQGKLRVTYKSSFLAENINNEANIIDGRRRIHLGRRRIIKLVRKKKEGSVGFGIDGAQSLINRKSMLPFIPPPPFLLIFLSLIFRR